MKQILLATDFSNGAGNAMEYALELAKVLEQEVCVLHAMGSLEGVDNNMFKALYIEDYQNSKRDALKTWASSFSEKEAYKAVPVTTTVGVGSVTSVIAKYVSEHPVTIIVMGASGSSGITGLFGSSASSVVDKTTTPILIVPQESTFSANPTITLATDYTSALSPEDVEALNELVQAFGSKQVRVLNVGEKSDSANAKEGEANLKQLINGTELVFNYISEADPISGILGFIEGSQTDIVCLVKHHHSIIYRIFNRSTVHRVLNRSIKAVLVLHE